MNNKNTMSIDFKEKVILITGASTGIGLETALLFAGLGGKVAICGRNKEKLDIAENKLKEISDNILCETCDVNDSNDLSRFTSIVTGKFGKIDIWISNAGIYPQYSLIDTPDSVWCDTVKTNQTSILLSAKEVYRAMKHTGGVFLIASSFSAKFPSVGSGAYAATKSAVSSMVKTLSAELAPYNIRVNGYMPGVIDTNMTRGLIESNSENMKKVIAMRKFGEPIDVAWSLAFLASEYARYITGEILEISGGKMNVQNPEKAWEDKENRK